MGRITALSFIVPASDLERATAFYKQAFGLEAVYRGDQILFVGNPGSETAVGLLLEPEHAGAGPQNVGLHVDHATPPDDAVRDAVAAGGTVIERGEHAPDVPYARIADPDGNVLWI